MKLRIPSLMLILLTLAAGCSTNSIETTATTGGIYTLKLVKLDQIAFVPGDFQDLFPGASMSISQESNGDKLRTLKITYPTNSMDRVIAFSEGFETFVKVYSSSSDAQRFHEKIINDYRNAYQFVDGFSDNRTVLRGNLIAPGDIETGNIEYILLFRDLNVVVMTTLRGPADFMVAPARLTVLFDTLAQRISSQPLSK